MSSSFLLLPREIRDLIMLEAMILRAPAPTRSFRTIPPPGTNGQLYLWSERSKWQSFNLLGVNQQIRAEVQELTIQLHNSHQIRFEIDILAKGYTYTPKWTLQNLALRPRSNLTLQVNLRILSTEAFRAHDNSHNSHNNNHNNNNHNSNNININIYPNNSPPPPPPPPPPQPGHIFKTLLNFLSRFLHLGPTFLNDDATFLTPGPFYLDALMVDVTFQDDYTRATHAKTVHEIFRMLKALSRLESARRYMGKIRGRAEWHVRGEEFRWRREWDLTGGERGELKEEDWAALEYYFGEAWATKYGCRRFGGGAQTMGRRGGMEG